MRNVKRHVLWSLVLLLTFAGFAQGQQEVVSNDITTNTTWVASNEYILNGLIFVDSLITLTIEPGTIIKGREQGSITSGDGASALIVRRGAKIMAEGTAQNPIIFTSELDDVSDPDDLTPMDRELWGGVIVLGRATTNEPGTPQIEGIPETEDATYGGDDDADNSGILRYVSIRHGGFSISGVSGDEINGLTLGAVGSGTTIEFIEVFANFDDGYEWFGGTVNSKYLVAAFCGDDGFDYDQGFRGKGQFWFSINAEDEAGRGGEHDGGDTDETGMPFSTPNIWNATYIGSGASLAPPPGGDGNNHALIFRDNAAGMYSNSIFTDFTGDGVDIEDLGSGEDSRSRLENGDLQLRDNLWWNFGAGNELTDIIPQTFVRNSSNFSGNSLADPIIQGISRAQDGGLDPRPSVYGPAASAPSLPPSDGFFTPADYVGAFNPNDSFETIWISGWTALDQDGILGSTAGTTITMTDDISSNATWLSKNEYLLNGLIFVDTLNTLTIEAGTVIKGLEQGSITSGDGASALIVRRGANIVADGKADAPIVFTSELDDVDDPGDLLPTDRQLWGGVIVLGRATTNEPGTPQIEGIPETEDATYGGDDDADNSGILRYISIRHGGFSISGVSGDEINGLTMGAVGSGTTIEFIEVFANFDDGYEWFGGTVNSKYLVAAFCGDDGFDYDQGFRGKGQFWFSINAEDEAGRGGEHDGGDTDETGMPFSTPNIWNATYIGSGASLAPPPGGDGNNHALIFRDNAGGMYSNSIFTDFTGDGVSIEDLGSGEDSRSRLENGDLQLRDNIWWSFGTGSNLEDIVPQDFVRSSDNFSGNTIEDPLLNSISRTQDGGLDPAPSGNGPAASVNTTPPNDGFFTQASYKGAFAPDASLWTDGWTALDADNVTSVEERRVDTGQSVPASFSLQQNYPNPFNPTTNIDYNVARTGEVELSVFNMRGQRVAVLVNGVRSAGTYTVNWDASDMASGVYLYKLRAGNTVVTKKMMLLK